MYGSLFSLARSFVRSLVSAHIHTLAIAHFSLWFGYEICIVRLCHASIVAAVAAKCCLLARTFNFNWNNYTDRREL